MTILRDLGVRVSTLQGAFVLASQWPVVLPRTPMSISSGDTSALRLPNASPLTRVPSHVIGHVFSFLHYEPGVTKKGEVTIAFPPAHLSKRLLVALSTHSKIFGINLCGNRKDSCEDDWNRVFFPHWESVWVWALRSSRALLPFGEWDSYVWPPLQPTIRTIGMGEAWIPSFCCQFAAHRVLRTQLECVQGKSDV